jgi:hypothetical protein
LPAMNAQIPHSFRQHASSLTTIAAKPAPTGECERLKGQVGPKAASVALAVVAP